MQTRRNVLASSGAIAIAGIAGCLGANGNDSNDNGNDGSSDEDYPSEQIRLIIPYGEGGGTDTYLRNISPMLEGALGARIAIDNIPGAATLRAQGELATADPDGYTMLATALPGVAASSMITPPNNFDPKEFVSIATFATDSQIMITHPDDEVESYSDIDDRFADGEFETCSGTFLGSPHLLAYVAKELHNLSWSRFIGFPGTGPTLESVAAGETDVGIVSPGAVAGLVEGGNLDVATTLTSERASQFPDVPSITDEGYEAFDYVAQLTRTLIFPEGTPIELADRLNPAVEEALESDEVQQWSEDTGNPITYLGREETQQHWDDLFENVPKYADLDAIREDEEEDV